MLIPEKEYTFTLSAVSMGAPQHIVGKFKSLACGFFELYDLRSAEDSSVLVGRTLYLNINYVVDVSPYEHVYPLHSMSMAANA